MRGDRLKLLRRVMAHKPIVPHAVVPFSVRERQALLSEASRYGFSITVRKMDGGMLGIWRRK